MPAILDDTFYPILLMGLDEPFSPGEIETYLWRLVAIANEGILNDKRHVVIVTNDPLKVSAAGRRKIAEAVTAHMKPAQVDVTLASFLPIDNTIVRGVVTAFSWFSPNTVKTLRIVDSMESALREALLALEKEGTPFSGDLPALRRALRLAT